MHFTAPRWQEPGDPRLREGTAFACSTRGHRRPHLQAVRPPHSARLLTELTPPAHLVREMGMALGLGGGLQGGGPLLLHVCACPVIGPPHYSSCKVRTGGSIPHPGVKSPYCLLTGGWPPTSTGCMQSPGAPGPCSLAETTGDLWLLAHLYPLPSPQTPRTRAWLGSYPPTL